MIGLIPRLAIEVDSPVERAVVRHGDCFHAEFFRAVHEGGDLRHSVEQRILGMSV
jgi:hypothetical protein